MRDGFSEREIVYRAEDLILRLRDVRSCRIITDETGAISEIHVVASSDRPPKMIARDVETALKAELGLQIDYRKIGVVMIDTAGSDLNKVGVQAGPDHPSISPPDDPVSIDDLVDERLMEMGDAAVQDEIETISGPFSERDVPLMEEEPSAALDDQLVNKPAVQPEAVSPPVQEPAAETLSGGGLLEEPQPGLELLEETARIGFRGLSYSMEKDSIKAEVVLTSDGLEVIGCVDEICGSRPVFEAIAGAAVKALMELLDENFHLCLSEIKELEITGRKALMAVVDVIRGRDSSSLSGCAFVGRDPGEAAVMAVLDAVNRPFGRWKSRREIHYRIR
jgi:hypothetical protein